MKRLKIGYSDLLKMSVYKRRYYLKILDKIEDESKGTENWGSGKIDGALDDSVL